MANFRKFADKAKDAVDKRGGTDALKADAQELRKIAKGEGSIKDKAKRAGEALKDPGSRNFGNASGGRAKTEARPEAAPERPVAADRPAAKPETGTRDAGPGGPTRSK